MRRLRARGLFSSAVGLPRSRRATDVLVLVSSVIGLVLVGVVARPEPAFSRAITQLLVTFPGAMLGLWQLLADALALWALALIVLALGHRRVAIGRDMILSVVVAIVLWQVLARSVDGSFPSVLDALRSAEPPPEFPAPRLMVTAAVIITASPHLVYPARRFGRWLIGLAALASIALQDSAPPGVIAALLGAAATAAIVHLVVGSSAGRPSLDDVRVALTDLGVRVDEMGAADRQDAGHFSVSAVAADGGDLVVKLYGRDALDSALVTTVWRMIWLREPGAHVGFGRLRQVEHEAFLTLLAAQAGIPTDAVVTAGATERNDAVLVLRRTGHLVAPPVEGGAPGETEIDPTHEPDIAALWALVDRLHDHDITHGQLDVEHLIVADGEYGLIDFRAASVAPSLVQRRVDSVQMFATTVMLSGTEAAIAGLIRHRDREAITELLPFIQDPSLTMDQRRWFKAADIDVDDLRAQVATALEIEVPQLVKLRRFSIGSVVRIALPLFALWMLVSSLAGFDWPAFVDSLRAASWWLVAIGLVVAQLPRLAQAISTLGASPVALPLGPVYALQLSISYVNLAIPTAAARIAVNIRFFQRQGVPPGAAIATGALDGVSGFIVQAALLTSLLLFGNFSLDLDIGGPASDAANLLAIVVVIGLVLTAIVAAIPKVRAFALLWIRRTAHEAFGVLRGLKSPRRLFRLFGGNLAAELLFATALGIFLQAFGYSLGIADLLFINMAVSLLSGLIPIPGGIGVTEGGLIFGLTAAGVPQEIAFAAVILYRLGTFYLPPIWGFFALRWLERSRYL
jgi:uncharacterized membrane protein YbhN (UPF0104 family)